MNSRRTIRFGVIGCGLMGREFASAAARWCHLSDVDFQPEIVAVCDANPRPMAWFQDHVPSVKRATSDYQELLDDDSIDAIYCAVPHNLHASIYGDIIKASKHLLGEKPFGIGLAANQQINDTLAQHPEVLVRCSSELPFYPGAFKIGQWVRENRFGQILDVNVGFWHSSDLNPNKPINWKRRIATNGEYGCMGDLGMHVMHLPLRFGWMPDNLRAILSNVVKERPGADGQPKPCGTWDNATLACEVQANGQHFPMLASTKRIAPGHANTWFIEINGTQFSARFSTANPKQVASLPYTASGSQAWHVEDVSHVSAYPVITGGIFEFGFSDSILQMWAAFCDELVHGRAGMSQPLHCATPTEAAATHHIFTLALQSNRDRSTVQTGPMLCT